MFLVIISILCRSGSWAIYLKSFSKNKLSRIIVQHNYSNAKYRDPDIEHGTQSCINNIIIKWSAVEPRVSKKQNP